MSEKSAIAGGEEEKKGFVRLSRHLGHEDVLVSTKTSHIQLHHLHTQSLNV
jgi:hypothetical protein